MNYDVIQTKLQKMLTTKRYQHSVGVSETAAMLAVQYGANVNQARLAGMVHDCARELPSNTLLQMAATFGIVLNDVELRQSALLHAPVGAKLIAEDYGIHDAAIRRAVALHTTGGPNLTLLEKIIYLADFIEPGRNFPGVDKLRQLAGQNLDAAVLAAYDQSLQYIIAQRGLVHPATIEGRNNLLVNMK